MVHRLLRALLIVCADPSVCRPFRDGTANRGVAAAGGRSEQSRPPQPSGAVTAPDATPSPGRAVVVGLRELSPWSMFLSAEPRCTGDHGRPRFRVAGHLDRVRREVYRAVGRQAPARCGACAAAGNARSLAESLAALPSDKSVMRTFVATAINEARLSTDIDNETGIKERAASSFSEITRARGAARAPRHGRARDDRARRRRSSGCSAPCGAS